MSPKRAEQTKRRAHRLLPFAVVGALAFLLVCSELSTIEPRPMIVALTLSAAIMAAELFVPWQALSRWWRGVPAFCFLLVVALLRHGEGGAPSAYGALVLLPIVWFALYGSRAELIGAVLGSGLIFAVPVGLIGGDQYPPAELRAALVFVAVSGMIGLIVQSLVRQLKQRRVVAEQRSVDLAEAERRIAEQAENLTMVVQATRDFATLESAHDLRMQICDVALSVVGGDLAFFCEPSTDHHTLRITASTAVDLIGQEVPLDRESGVAVAFSDNKPLFAPLAHAHPLISKQLIARTRVETALAQPVTRNGITAGVLCLGWYRVTPYLSDRRIALLELLAAEAAGAVERAALMARLAEMARTDELTGLPNRREWDESLARELARAQRGDQPLTVAMIDLDNFKDYNDLLGHQAGDRLLKNAAAAWQHELRTTDVLARYGGEEFALALPDCSAGQAMELAERLRAVMPYSETCSIGLAEWNGHESGESLMDRADGALYKAKAAGRDRTMAANWLPVTRSA